MSSHNLYETMLLTHSYCWFSWIPGYKLWLIYMTIYISNNNDNVWFLEILFYLTYRIFVYTGNCLYLSVTWKNLAPEGRHISRYVFDIKKMHISWKWCINCVCLKCIFFVVEGNCRHQGELNVIYVYIYICLYIYAFVCVFVIFQQYLGTHENIPYIHRP